MFRVASTWSISAARLDLGARRSSRVVRSNSFQPCGKFRSKSTPPGGSSLIAPSPSLSRPSGSSRYVPACPFARSAFTISRGSSSETRHSPSGSGTRICVMTPSPSRSSAAVLVGLAVAVVVDGAEVGPRRAAGTGCPRRGHDVDGEARDDLDREPLEERAQLLVARRRGRGARSASRDATRMPPAWSGFRPGDDRRRGRLSRPRRRRAARRASPGSTAPRADFTSSKTEIASLRVSAPEVSAVGSTSRVVTWAETREVRRRTKSAGLTGLRSGHRDRFTTDDHGRLARDWMSSRRTAGHQACTLGHFDRFNTDDHGCLPRN